MSLENSKWRQVTESDPDMYGFLFWRRVACLGCFARNQTEFANVGGFLYLETAPYRSHSGKGGACLISHRIVKYCDAPMRPASI